MSKRPTIASATGLRSHRDVSPNKTAHLRTETRRRAPLPKAIENGCIDINDESGTYPLPDPIDQGCVAVDKDVTQEQLEKLRRNVCG